MTFTDWSVQSVNLHIALKAMFYLLNNSFEKNKPITLEQLSKASQKYNAYLHYIELMSFIKMT